MVQKRKTETGEERNERRILRVRGSNMVNEENKKIWGQKGKGMGFFFFWGGGGRGSTIRNFTLMDMVLLTNLLTSYEKEHVFI